MTKFANDWAPAIAADSNGAVYIGWDSYGAGNYDALLRRWSDGSWGDEIKIAASHPFSQQINIICSVA